ncbi:hypothetical protein DFR60_110245 [Hungatella effluvii]|uniref:Uncharacterized protein n=1 Tax=Hungatella effluvii TaxID=1096246 RepID=A0A2V3Y214_9FIRM|nr:hypothetical protein DFR60_110245 [Hungatella effluvii]
MLKEAVQTSYRRGGEETSLTAEAVNYSMTMQSKKSLL